MHGGLYNSENQLKTDFSHARKSAPRASALWSLDDVAVRVVSALLTATVITGPYDAAELCNLSRAGVPAVLLAGGQPAARGD